jgi:hypothetical protein
MCDYLWEKISIKVDPEVDSSETLMLDVLVWHEPRDVCFGPASKTIELVTYAGSQDEVPSQIWKPQESEILAEIDRRQKNELEV